MKISQKSIEYKVLKEINEHNLISPGDNIIIALSGGPDSICLLSILERMKTKIGFKLLACHYNHRLRGEDSYNDENFVAKTCEERGIECILGKAAEENMYKNEEEARNARYAFFEKILGERRGAKIALAHNSNDLAETFLLRLVRGTGVRGLTGIPLIRKKFIRPLLSISRLEIENYLEKEKLKYRIDKTNFDAKIARNFIRLKVIPLLSERLNPNLVETLGNSAKVLESDYELLEGLAEREYQKIIKERNSSNLILDRKGWLGLHQSLQRLVIRLAVRDMVGLVNITNKQVGEVCKMIEKGEGKKHKLLPHSLRIELASGKIILSKISRISM